MARPIKPLLIATQEGERGWISPRFSSPCPKKWNAFSLLLSHLSIYPNPASTVRIEGMQSSQRIGQARKEGTNCKFVPQLALRARYLEK